MLDHGTRRLIDSLWDRVWSAGITNPLAAAEYLMVPLLLARRDRLSHANVLDQVVAAAKNKDQKQVAQIMAVVCQEFGLGEPLLAHTGNSNLLLTLSEGLRGLVADEGDAVGDIFEHVLNKLSSAGQFGQFRTPTHIIHFLVQLVALRGGETVLDPACGTGGFLVAALGAPSAVGLKVIGDETDVSMLRIARANLVLHGAPATNIRHRDALAHLDEEADVVLTNPPFAGRVDPSRSANFAHPTNKTELLFIQLINQRLRRAGRAGVVVPFGVIGNSGPSAQAIRKDLVESSRLNAVVELPAGVFRPYTDVKTALLLWTKGSATRTIGFVRIDHDGFTLDDKRAPTDRNDLPAALRFLRGESPEAGLCAARIDASAVRANGYNLSPGRYLSTGTADVRPPAARPALLHAARDVDQAARALDGLAVKLRRLNLDHGARDWPKVPLGEVVEVRRAQIKPGEIEEGEIYVGLEHVESRTGIYKPTIVGRGDLRSSKFRFEVGDVLYGKLRPILRKSVVALERGVCSTDLVPLRPLTIELGPIIAAQLRSEWFAHRVNALIGGASLPRISVRDLLQIEIAAPTTDDLGDFVELLDLVQQIRQATGLMTDAVDPLSRSIEELLRT